MTKITKTKVSKIYQNSLALIGNTPLINLQHISFNLRGHIFAKLETVNPGGSIKDRPALKIIERAYQQRRLCKGQSVIEMTSGNMGSGLAVVCNVFGNPFTAVMSQGNSPARVKMLEALGAQVILVPQVDGSPQQVTGHDITAASLKAKEIANQCQGFYVNQFQNIGSVLAHQEGTGPEIWHALDGKLDAFVASVGSGGTFTGCSRYLKSKKANIYCAAVEPCGQEVLTGKPITKRTHIIQGTGYGFVPQHWDARLADGVIAVSDEEVVHYRKLLANKEGLDVGYSSGANVCAAIKLLESEKLPADATVVTILCDLGLKYF